MLNKKRQSDLERLHVRERDEWEQKADAQMRSAVSAAEQAVKINGISKGDIDAELRYQAQQIDFMYDSMKDAKTKMAVMKRDLEAERLKAHNSADGAHDMHNPASTIAERQISGAWAHVASPQTPPHHDHSLQNSQLRKAFTATKFPSQQLKPRAVPKRITVELAPRE
ncbi:hypothetical protein WJX75_007204 [Coccomyxa subellipsoidea]|uniref:Uncharacterized protein n=1 Tax=Coccomyxa subellipsoidea TaxID=248742 RepID=A0ABR2YK68_9CHLO